MSKSLLALSLLAIMTIAIGMPCGNHDDDDDKHGDEHGEIRPAIIRVI